MALEGNCDQCNSLREEASAAIHRHLRAVGRRELARLRHDSEAMEALDAEMNKAAADRERVVAAFKQHMDSHRAGQTPAAAKSGR